LHLLAAWFWSFGSVAAKFADKFSARTPHDDRCRKDPELFTLRRVGREREGVGRPRAAQKSLAIGRIEDESE
jgi:hypothetical protein